MATHPMAERAARPDPDRRATKPGAGSLPRGELHVWLVDLIGADLGANLLSAGERARARRFVRAADGQRFAACRVAVRNIVAAYLASDPATIAFEESGTSRPRLLGSDEPIELSWSRSADLALVAVGEPGVAVGVDVETVRALPEQSVLHEEFGDRLGSDRELLQAWTRLEAALKATGAGLAGLSADVGAQMAGSTRQRIITVSDLDLRVVDLQLGSRAVGAAATSLPGPVRFVLRRWPG